MVELPRPRFGGEGGAGKPGVVSERCDAPARVVGQKLEIEQSASAAGKTGQHGFPPGLVLVTVRELDVRVDEGNCTFI